MRLQAFLGSSGLAVARAEQQWCKNIQDLITGSFLAAMLLCQWLKLNAQSGTEPDEDVFAGMAAGIRPAVTAVWLQEASGPMQQ